MTHGVTMLRLPVMRCDAGCGDCCGPVPVNEADYQRVTAYAAARGVVPLRQGLKCPYYQHGTCQVYEVRPLMCRLFGHSTKLRCSRGYNRNLPEPVIVAELTAYIKADTRPRRMLHEALAGGPS